MNSQTNLPAMRVVVDHTLITITFADESVISVEAAKMAYETRDACMMHGIKQKLLDAAAMSRGATIEDKYEAVLAVAERFNSGGAFNAIRAATDGGGGLLARSLTRMYAGRQTPEQIRAYCAKLSRKQQLALLASDKVKPFADAIRAESTRAPGADTDELLSALDN